VIYFIQMGEGGPIKIGKADDPWRRLSGLQIGCPTSLKLLGTVDGDRRREAGLHQDFDDARIRGEWFFPVPDLMKLISESASLPARPPAAQIGRPIAKDPKVQRNIFPETSLWDRAVAIAESKGIKPTVYAAEALRERVERDEKNG
jgi:hypothetical protein